MPQGRLLDWAASLTLELLRGCAAEFARVLMRVDDLVRESDPRNATELLPEHEDVFRLPATGTLEERRARVVARRVRRQRFRPVDIKAALAPLLGQAPADVVIIERTLAFCAAVRNEREIYRFLVYRDPNAPGAYFLDSAQALLDKMSPSHTQGHVIESIAFRVGDPHSLVGRDILGSG